MNMLSTALHTVLRQPDPAGLVALQEALLAGVAPSSERDRCLELTGQFHRYLVGLQARLTARQYSELASWLDMTAVGLVAFEEMLRGAASDWRSLLIGLASEGAMVWGSRQYVKAWAVEVGPIHEDAAWALREALWRLSEETQPDLPAGQRLDMVRRAVPAELARAEHSVRAVALGRLFQTLLLLRVSRLGRAPQPDAP
jgi:hypothetical protein